MSIRAEELETSFSLDGTTFSILGGERAITTPAREMSLRPEDMPARWEIKHSRLMDQPRFGQRDYAVARFSLMDGGTEKADISFETVVYNDQKTALAVLIGTLSRMASLKLSKVDVGDAGAMIEVQGKVGRKMRAVVLVERNVFGLILLSYVPGTAVSDSWLISMARLMASRMR